MAETKLCDSVTLDKLLLNSAMYSCSRLFFTGSMLNPDLAVGGVSVFHKPFLSAHCQLHQRYIELWLSTDWLLQAPMRICMCWSSSGCHHMTNTFFKDRESERRSEWTGEREGSKAPFLAPQEAKDTLMTGLNWRGEKRRGEQSSLSDDIKDKTASRKQEKRRAGVWRKKGWERWKDGAGGMYLSSTDKDVGLNGWVLGLEMKRMKSHWSAVTSVYRDLTNKHQRSNAQ